MYVRVGKYMYTYARLLLSLVQSVCQANLLALSWSREGQFLLLSEKIIVSLLLVHCFVVVLLGWTAVSYHTYLT